MIKKIMILIFAMVLLSVSAPVRHGSEDDSGLVGHWAFEGNALDLSGNGNDRTITGAKITSGVKGRAMDFDGRKEKFINDVTYYEQLYQKCYIKIS